MPQKRALLMKLINTTGDVGVIKDCFIILKDILQRFQDGNQTDLIRKIYDADFMQTLVQLSQQSDLDIVEDVFRILNFLVYQPLNQHICQMLSVCGIYQVAFDLFKDPALIDNRKEIQKTIIDFLGNASVDNEELDCTLLTCEPNMIQLLTEMLQVNPDDRLTETSIWLMGNLFSYEYAKDYIEAQTLKVALPFIINLTDHPGTKIRQDAFYVCEKIYYLDSERLRDIKLEMIDHES